jgi:hypothetical protein
MIPVGILTAAAKNSFSFLLDLYPSATAAYSLRKLRSAYTGDCIQVRRSSDNATQNIGFVNNVIDSTTLLTFCGAGNGFVTTWYDQSGNAKNAIQNTLANQPQIVSSGVVIKVNSKPALLVDNTDKLQITPILNLINSSLLTTFSLFKRSGNNILFIFYGLRDSVKNYIYLNKYGFDVNGISITSQIDTTADQTLITSVNVAPSITEQYKNNVLLTKTIASFPCDVKIEYIFSDGTNNSTGWGQEFIIYNANQNSNISEINANINAFYTIY